MLLHCCIFSKWESTWPAPCLYIKLVPSSKLYRWIFFVSNINVVLKLTNFSPRLLIMYNGHQHSCTFLFSFFFLFGVLHSSIIWWYWLNFWIPFHGAADYMNFSFFFYHNPLTFCILFSKIQLFEFDPSIFWHSQIGS